MLFHISRTVNRYDEYKGEEKRPQFQSYRGSMAQSSLRRSLGGDQALGNRKLEEVLEFRIAGNAQGFSQSRPMLVSAGVLFLV